MLNLPVYEDVVAASGRIEGHAHRTPFMTSRTMDQEVGAQIFFKCENLQRMGAFKFRGAFNALSTFDEAQRKALENALRDFRLGGAELDDQQDHHQQ